MEKFKKNINNQIRSTLNVDVRWGSPRIDGKKRLTDKISNQTTDLMKEFYLWVNKNFIASDMFSEEPMFIPKEEKIEHFNLDQLLNQFLENKIK